jgi:release factor glutamine methyltransferase
MSTLSTISDVLAQHLLLVTVSDSARLDVEVLLAAALKKERTYLYTWPEKILSPAEQRCFDEMFQRRINGEPIAYILGEKEFWSLSLQVNSSTLIPRPETELLVETALSLFQQDAPLVERHIIDLGTGTGAIALALASEKPHWQIVAVDSSPAACSLAERNRLQHQLNNVQLICSDWFNSLSKIRVDMIVSNPPYIDKNDPHLQQGDVRFEPHSALIADQQGIADIALIAQQATEKLLPKGWLLIEHGYQQADAVMAVFQKHGYQSCSTVMDMAGQARVTMGQRWQVLI